MKIWSKNRAVWGKSINTHFGTAVVDENGYLEHERAEELLQEKNWWESPSDYSASMQEKKEKEDEENMSKAKVNADGSVGFSESLKNKLFEIFGRDAVSGLIAESSGKAISSKAKEKTVLSIAVKTLPDSAWMQLVEAMADQYFQNDEVEESVKSEEE